MKVIRVRLLPWVVFREVLNGPSSLQKRNATLNMDLNSPLLSFGAYLRNPVFLIQSSMTIYSTTGYNTLRSSMNKGPGGLCSFVRGI